MIGQILRPGWCSKARLAMVASRCLVKVSTISKNCSTNRRGPSIVHSAQAASNEARKSSESVGASFEPNESSVGQDKELIAHLHDRLQSVKGRGSLIRVLISIEPVLQQFKPSQFGVVFDLFNELIMRLKSKKFLTVRESASILRSAPSFVSLLSRSNSNIKQLDPAGLTALLGILAKINLNPESAIVQKTIHQLSTRLDELNLSQLSSNLFRIDFYADQFQTCQLAPFRASLLEHCRTRILDSNELEPDNVYLVAELLFSFLVNFKGDQNSETVEHLARMLLSPDVQLDFFQSVKLLHKIRSAGKPQQTRFKEAYPQALTDLIDRCNNVAYQTLESNPNAKNHFKFLQKVHGKRVRSNSYLEKNLFDPRLLDLLAAFLVKRHSAGQRIRHSEDAYYILNLVYNYSKFGFYNEQLVELLHSLVCSGMHPKNDFAFPEYQLLTSHRWPFLNQPRLLEILKSSKRFLDIRQQGHTYTMLCHLILNDVNDPDLLHYLNQNKNSNREAYLVQAPKLVLIDYCQAALARAVLSFGNLGDKHLESELRQAFDQRLSMIAQNPDCPKVGSSFAGTLAGIDSKLQEGCFLSNGVFVEAFAIYDKSIGDLIPLDRFKGKFDEIDTIPLTDDQEFLAFIRSHSLRGTVTNYESIQDYQLRRILEACDFKTVTINVLDLLALETPEEWVWFYIRKALESCR